MSDSTNRLGRLGEDLAVRHLQTLGYRIVARNWRAASADVRGEVDVIAEDGASLVFCEVKSRRQAVFDNAFAAVNWSKQRQLRRLAALYLAGRTERVDVRFDVVAVALPVGGGAAAVEHIAGAF